MSLQALSRSRPTALHRLQLPTLMPGATNLLVSLSEEDTCFEDLVELIERFPNIAGRLLALANSAWSAPAKCITSTGEACARLGFGVVRSTSIALAVASPFDSSRCPAFDAQRYWGFSLLCAEGAAALAASAAVTEPDPSTARTAGLLHSLGMLWLVDALPERLGRVFDAAGQEKGVSVSALLGQDPGFDHVEAGRYLADIWQLPPPLAVALGHYRDTDYAGSHCECAFVTGVAVELMSAVWHDEPCPADDPRLRALGLDQARIETIYRQSYERLPRIRDLAATLFAGK